MPEEARTIIALVGAGQAEAVAGCPLSVLEEGLDSAKSGSGIAQPTAWLVPHARAAEQAREALSKVASRDRRASGDRLAGGSRLAPGIRTLRQLADAILAAGPDIPRPLTGVQRRALVSEVLATADRAGRLQHFGRVAARGRLVEHLSRAFSELSLARLATSDEDPRPRPSLLRIDDAASEELDRLYRSYRKLMTRHTLLDDEDRLATATRLVHARQLGPLAGIRRVLVTGFREFNPLERSLVGAIARVVESTVIVVPWGGTTLPAEDSTAQASGPTPWLGLERSLAKLAEHCPRVGYERFDANRAAAEAPEAERVREWLFRDPRQVVVGLGKSETEGEKQAASASQRPPTKSRYRVIAAPTAQDEFAQVAGRVKALLLAGVAPEEVVLATRRVETVAPLAEQAFGEVGAPLAVDSAQRLADAPLFRTLGQLVRLATDDWRRADLLGVVTAPSLTLFDQSADETSFRDCRAAGFAGPRAATEWILRELLLAGGQAKWREQLEANVPRDAAEKLSPGRRRRGVAAAVAHRAVARLSSELDAWRTPAGPLDWCDRFRAALATLGYRAAQSSSNEIHSGELLSAEQDAAALVALEESFAGLERLARWREAPRPELSLSEVADLLSSWAGSVRIAPAQAEEGHVRLLTVEAARLLRPKHLFLVGMTEQSFPAPPRASLVDGIDRTTVEHYSGEMLLFYELTQAARETVTFSFATLDAKGQPLSPSSYVAEIERLLAPVSLRERQPEGAHTAWSREALQRDAVRALNAGDAQPLGKLASPRAEMTPLVAGLRVSLDRSSGDHFGASEGVLPGAAAHNWLASHYNVEHLWSPTQLETYAECPFKFYLRQVLGIEPVEEFDLSIDYRRRGSLVHNALLRMHQRLKEQGNLQAMLSKLSPEEFIEAFGEAVIHALESHRRGPQEAVLAEIEAMQATGWAGAYREQLTKYSGGDDSLKGRMQPAYFEVRFGPLRRGAEEKEGDEEGDEEDEEPVRPPSREEPFAFEIDGETVLLTGQVDRIDLGEIDGQKVFNIVDYKTAASVAARASELRDGRQLQLYLYMLATQHHLLADEGALPWRLGYWALRDKGFKQPIEDRKPLQPGADSDAGVTSTAEWDALGAIVKQRLTQIVHGIRGGNFPMYNLDEHCGARCEFRTTCRVGQTRSLGKTPESEPGEPAAAEPPTRGQGNS